jgi:sterol desaturase/sphingolipid hydroxylase (fatty acid hydroxylase superfamily)
MMIRGGLSATSVSVLLSAVLVLAATAEGLVMTRRHQPYDWKAYFAAFGSLLGRGITRALLQSVPFGLAVGLLDLAWSHRLLTLPLTSAWALAALFLGEELFYYWFHRVSHHVRWFWATHAVHHSPNQLTLTTAYQLGWTGELTGSLLFFVPLAWLGFRPAAILATVALNLLYQFWLHTQWVPKLGVLEWAFNTPSHHRVHHACNREYLGETLGANYGGVLIIFDRLFGTCVPERPGIPCRYGLTRPLHSYNPLYIAFHEWIAMAQELLAARTWRERLRVMVGPPTGARASTATAQSASPST